MHSDAVCRAEQSPSSELVLQHEADKGVVCRRSDGILHEVLVKAAVLPLAQRPTLALVLAALLASMESAALIEAIILVRVRSRAGQGQGRVQG